MKIDEVEDIDGDTRLAEAGKPLVKALKDIEDTLPAGGVRVLVWTYDPKVDEGHLMLCNYMGEEDALLDTEKLPAAIKQAHGG